MSVEAEVKQLNWIINRNAYPDRYEATGEVWPSENGPIKLWTLEVWNDADGVTLPVGFPTTDENKFLAKLREVAAMYGVKA